MATSFTVAFAASVENVPSLIFPSISMRQSSASRRLAKFRRSRPPWGWVTSTNQVMRSPFFCSPDAFA
jgi:hypothetical protein